MQWATDALRIRPDDPDALRDRGNWNAELGRLRDAAADFEHLLRVEPQKTSGDLLALALLRASLDDQDGYQGACREMVKRFGAIPDAAWEVGEALTLAPNDIADPKETLQRLAQHPDYVGPSLCGSDIYSWACVRAGKAEDVVQAFSPGQPLFPPKQPETALALALAHHQLGQAESARTWLNKADHMIEQRTEGLSGRLAGQARVELGVAYRSTHPSAPTRGRGGAKGTRAEAGEVTRSA